MKKILLLVPVLLLSVGSLVAQSKQSPMESNDYSMMECFGMGNKGRGKHNRMGMRGKGMGMGHMFSDGKLDAQEELAMKEMFKAKGMSEADALKLVQLKKEMHTLMQKYFDKK